MSETKTFHLTVDLKSPSTFVGRSVEDGVPVTLPLKSLEDLLAWQPNDPDDKGQMFSVACVPHHPKLIKEGERSTLVCHDFKGGYLEDRFVQGVNMTSIPYHFLHWDKVDIFVYFSHNFVTIPPVGWINAGHRNGVTVLGTFITEWGTGYKRCKAFLAYPEIRKIVADRLVLLASFYGFDGWLVNIENEVQLSQVPSLISFVEYLTKQMKSVDKNSKVIWYDSVTVKGELQWQNELNKNNSCFFDVCDGIFLNYTWTEDNLKSSYNNAHQRAVDVFVGVDVFGRGCYGGGGYNTFEALEVIKRCNLSTALFAPGWVYENLGAANFHANDEKFWELISSYCEVHFSTGFVVNHSGVIRVGLTEIFSEKKFFFNMNDQQYLPYTGVHFNNPTHTMYQTLFVHNAMLDGIYFNCNLHSFNNSITLTSLTAVRICQITIEGLKLELNITGEDSVKNISGFTIQNFDHNKAGCYMVVLSADKEFVVKKIAASVQWLQLDTGNVVTKPSTIEKTEKKYTDYSVCDVSWKKGTGEGSLSLSFSLLFPKTMQKDEVNISYTINQQLNNTRRARDDTNVVSYCNGYRFNNLSVPNPVFYGKCSIELKVDNKLLKIEYF